MYIKTKCKKKALRRGTALGGSLKRTAALLQLGAQEGQGSLSLVSLGHTGHTGKAIKHSD